MITENRFEKTLGDNHIRRSLRTAAGWFVVLLTFLIPLKFGSLAVMPEAAGFFPEDFFSWLIINWPAHSFGIFSGFALLLALVSFKIPEHLSYRGITALLWSIVLPATAMIGFINTPVKFYAETQLWHLLGVSAYIAAVYLVLEQKSDNWYSRIGTALTFGVLLLCISGLRQYFFGFEEMREFIAKQREEGIVVHSVLRAKVADNRVYSTMVSANVLAGFLLLTAPFAVMWFRRLGSRFEPAKISMRFFAAVMLILTATVFLMTKTRAAFLCAMITVLILFFVRNKSVILRGIVAVMFIFSVLGGAWYIKYSGRGFGSFAERADYMRTALIMFPEKPLAGHGWGVFFYRHMREKTTSSDESAHDPHNIFLSFTIHCGAAAGAASVLCFFLPLAVLWKRRDSQDTLPYAGDAVFWGSAAFALHCCCDINMQIPACLAGQGLLFMLALPDENIKFPPMTVMLRLLLAGLLAVIGICSTFFNYRNVRGEQAFSVLVDSIQQPPGKIPDEDRILALYQNVEYFYKGYPFASSMLGDYYMSQFKYWKAEPFYLKALARDPGRPAVHHRLSKIAELKKDKAGQLEYMRRAHELFPTHPRYKLDKTP